MATLIELSGTDGNVWSLEQDSSDLWLFHASDTDARLGPQTCIPITPMVLQMMSIAARSAETPIQDARQNVIPFRRSA
jgi:hypothetical protein